MFEDNWISGSIDTGTLREAPPYTANHQTGIPQSLNNLSYRMSSTMDKQFSRCMSCTLVPIPTWCPWITSITAGGIPLKTTLWGYVQHSAGKNTCFHACNVLRSCLLFQQDSSCCHIHSHHRYWKWSLSVPGVFLAQGISQLDEASQDGMSPFLLAVWQRKDLATFPLGVKWNTGVKIHILTDIEKFSTVKESVSRMIW